MECPRSQELAAGDSPAEAALALKTQLVVAHLPPHVKLTLAKPANGSVPCLETGSANIPAGSTAALRSGAAHAQNRAGVSASMLSMCQGSRFNTALSSTGTHRYLAALGGSSLYPRPPFSGEARGLAGDIDSWLEFSNSTVAAALAQWSAAATEKVWRMALRRQGGMRRIH